MASKTNQGNPNDLLKQIENVNSEEPQGRDLGHVDVGREKRLTDDEERSRRAFEERAQRAFDASIGVGEFSQGWVDVDKTEMGERADYYPADWEFRIRPADVATIKNWSAVNEDYPPSVNATLNEALKNCLQITSSSGRVSWSQINSYDRFWFILKIRELTFAHVESKIEFDDECSECDEIIHYELNPQSLWYDMPDKSIYDKYFDRDTRTWTIDPREYDVDAPVVTLYQPTLDKDDAILTWVMNKLQTKKKYNESFLRFLPYLLKKSSKDEKVFERLVDEALFTFKSWSVDMFEFMDSVLTNIAITPQDTLMAKCPNCGMEARSSIKFPDGIKNLFASATNRHKKFGSK